MRTDDQPLPTIGGPRPGPNAPTGKWPADLYIGLDRQPVANYVYDDYTAAYDSPSHAFTYDDVQNWPYQRFDLTCRAHGLTVTVGGIDSDGRVSAGQVGMTLDNRDGSLSQYDAAGRLVDWVPGSALDIWVVLDGEPLWMFSGTVTAWRERADGTIDVEAFDSFSRLSDDVPEWNPGVYADTPSQRLAAILTAHDYTGPTRFDLGDVTLHSYLTTATPLAELQAVAASDGGLLFVDADGTLVYRNRLWPVGRDDQPDVPTFSDNNCEAESIVWDIEMTTDDDTIINRATLTNVAGVTVTSTNTASLNRYGPQSISRTDDQWIGTPAGQTLADLIVARRGDHYLRLEQFVLNLHDPDQNLWRTGIDRRIGDVVTFLHSQPTTTGVALIVLNLIVAQVVHDIRPTAWRTTIATTPTVSNVVALRYDRTPFRYGDPDPRVVYAA